MEETFCHWWCQGEAVLHLPWRQPWPQHRQFFMNASSSSIFYHQIREPMVIVPQNYHSSGTKVSHKLRYFGSIMKLILGLSLVTHIAPCPSPKSISCEDQTQSSLTDLACVANEVTPIELSLCECNLIVLLH